NSRSRHARDLHSSGSDAATNGVNEDDLTSAKRQSGEERVVCCEKNLRNRRGVLPRQSLWNWYRFALVHTKVFRVTGAADDSHYSVAILPKCRGRPDGIHLARVFHPR